VGAEETVGAGDGIEPIEAEDVEEVQPVPPSADLPQYECRRQDSLASSQIATSPHSSLSSRTVNLLPSPQDSLLHIDDLSIRWASHTPLTIDGNLVPDSDSTYSSPDDPR